MRFPVSSKQVQVARLLWQCVRETQSAGLSAIQLSFPFRMFVSIVPEAADWPGFVGERSSASLPTRQFGLFVNPQIVKVSNHVEYMVETCLSLPRSCLVERYTTVHIKYQTLSSTRQHLKVLRGDYARAFQHELDHLDGILITDRHIEPRQHFHHDDAVHFEQELLEPVPNVQWSVQDPF